MNYHCYMIHFNVMFSICKIFYMEYQYLKNFNMIYVYLILFCQESVFSQFVGIKSQNLNLKEKEEPNCTKGSNNTNENIDYLIPPLLQNLSINSTFQSGGEQEAAPDDIFVEVLITVDDKLYEMVGKSYSNGLWNNYGEHPKLSIKHPTLLIGDPKNETILYLRKFMTAVNMRYQNLCTSPKIHLHIAGMLIGEGTPFVKESIDDKEGLDHSATLENMVSHFGRESFRKVYHFDIVLFITGEGKLCGKRCKSKKRALGIAYLEGSCLGSVDLTQSVRTETYGVFKGVDTAAHEIGHLLGASHDGENNCCCSDDGYIMSDRWNLQRYKKRNMHNWSSCSDKAFSKYFATAKAAKCLYNKPTVSPYPLFEWEDLIAPNVPSLVEQCFLSRIELTTTGIFSSE
jgi:hypothetical protein